VTTRKILGAIILFALAFAATKVLVAGRWYRIPQNGMYPGLPSGSYVLVDPHPYRTPSNVQRGDIIVFVRKEGGADYTYIWRVVGLPGDSVKVEGRTVAINGQDLPRQPLREEGAFTILRETNGSASYDVAYPTATGAEEPPAVSLTLPANEFLVLGDNRYTARDSRHFGSIGFDTIIGKKIWSP
jgi:signal peptidase I